MNISKKVIAKNAAVILTPLPSCIILKSCTACLVASIGFDCRWCSKTKRCSDGQDRMRKDWMVSCPSNTVSVGAFMNVAILFYFVYRSPLKLTSVQLSGWVRQRVLIWLFWCWSPSLLCSALALLGLCTHTLTHKLSQGSGWLRYVRQFFPVFSENNMSQDSEWYCTMKIYLLCLLSNAMLHFEQFLWKHKKHIIPL